MVGTWRPFDKVAWRAKAARPNVKYPPCQATAPCQKTMSATLLHDLKTVGLQFDHHDLRQVCTVLGLNPVVVRFRIVFLGIFNEGGMDRGSDNIDRMV